jgi:Ca2+-binding RTX toxin-like protein
MSPRRRALLARSGALACVLTLSVSLVVSLALSLALSLGTAPAAGARTQETTDRGALTCNGQTPTLVGEPEATLIGTAGDDVVVTAGATRVDTGAGNDSICITGRGAVVVNAGPGDDSVGARGHQGKAFVSLGFGDDQFVGGDGPERVWTQESSNQTSPDDHDVVITNGGDDYVISGSSAAPNTDVVLLGAGNDVLVTYGLVAGAELTGGPGLNTLQPLPGPEVSGDWVVDNVEGQALLDGVVRLAWSSFQRFELTGLQGEGLRYLGSAASESVVTGGTCRAVLRGRAGDDRLRVDDEGCNHLPAGDALLVGGPGDDVLTGSFGNDVLRGGGGDDRANGGLGTNRCVAEHTSSC